MAVQQRRNSKTRKAKRRTHYKLAAPTLVKCPACGECANAVCTTVRLSLKKRKKGQNAFFLSSDF